MKFRLSGLSHRTILEFLNGLQTVKYTLILKRNFNYLTALVHLGQ